MDSLNIQYRDIVEKILQEYIDFLGNDDLAEVKLVLDEKRDRYLLVETGWQNGYRIYGNLIHIEIINRQRGLMIHGIKSRPTPMYCSISSTISTIRSAHRFR